MLSASAANGTLSALDTEDSCQESHDCELTSSQLSYKQRLQTCLPCPSFYPWLGDTAGLGGLADSPQPQPSLQRETPTQREREQPAGNRVSQRFRFAL